MRLFNLRHGMAVVLSLLLVLSAASVSHAFNMSLKGAEAERSLSMLRVAPYITYGSGSKVVYVLGSPDCSQTRGVFQLMQNMRNDYEFRWILKVPKNKKSVEDRFFGVYENRDSAALATVLSGGEAPVKNSDRIKPNAQLARTVGDVIVLDLKKKSVMFPLLVFPVSGGLRAVDFTKEMQDPAYLSSLISPAVADAAPEGVDLGLVMDDIARANSTGGYFCARSDTPYSILPYGGARQLGTLPKGACLEGVTTLDSGWVGVRYLPGAESGPAYLRADMVYQVNP